MSDTGENEATPPEEEGGEEERLGCLARIIPVTTPGCATFLTFVFLISTVITVWIAFWVDPSNIPWRHSYSWWRIAGIFVLVVAIPYVVYKTIEIWLEGVPVAFPDVDQAWRAGMQALAANELSIDSIPIFLITGSSGEAQEKAIMSASGLRLSVEGVPQGPAPIHWYANSEAIYLFCTDACWTSALASYREELASAAYESGMSIETPAMIQSRFDMASALMQPEPQAPSPTPMTVPAPMPTPMPAAEPTRPASASIRGTLELNEFVNPTQSKPLAANPSKPPASGGNAFRGTLMLGEAEMQSPQLSAAPALPAPAPTIEQSPVSQQYSQQYSQANVPVMTMTGTVDALSTKKPVLVSHQYSTACLQELQYVGHLVRSVRQPLCAINGVLALIQVESIHSTQVELEELQRAIRADLDTICNAFQVKVPVSALVVGMEKERGFRELIARVGKERAVTQRFGRRFDVQAIPARDQMIALATHLCGVFEDWAYTLFREEQALTRPGNTRLYELLSKVRCGWKGRLSDILAGGFGCDTTKREENASILFSGCYFAATGETPDRQAFVKGVIEKMEEEQELIEWTPEALAANKRQNLAANLGAIVAVGLLVSLGLMYLLLP